MVNPGVLSLASLQEIVPGFPYRFEIEDNIGEAIHIHYKDIRLDLTIREFLVLADTAGMLIDNLVEAEGFSREQFDPIHLAAIAGSLPHIGKFQDDEVMLSSIIVDTVDSDGVPCYGTLKDSRVFRALHGDTRQNDLHHEVNYYKPCSADRYTNEERLRSNLEWIRQRGYPDNQERILLAEKQNIIWDGQHRAACLYYCNGDMKVPVRRGCFGNADELIIEREDIVGSLYYRTGELAFQDEVRFTTFANRLREGQSFTLEPDTVALRFDPLEGQFCAVSNFEVSSELGSLPFLIENGVQYQDQIYFVTTDPKIEILLPQAGIHQVTIKALVTPLSEDQLNEAVCFLKDEAERQEACSRQMEAQAEELRHQLEKNAEHAAALEQRLAEQTAYGNEQAARADGLSLRLQEEKAFAEIWKGKAGEWEDKVDEQTARVEELTLRWQDESDRADAWKAIADEQVYRADRLLLRSQTQERVAAEQSYQIELLNSELHDIRVHYDNMEHSISFRVGRILTWLPRKLKPFLKQKFVMPNYYDDLENRINICETRFGGSPRRTALRMIWWNFKSLFKCHVLPESSLADTQRDDLPPLDENRLNVAFLINGGFGDNLVTANYIACFRRKYDCPQLMLDVFFEGGWGLADSIFEPGVVCDRFFSVTGDVSHRYDLYIRISCRYPDILDYRSERIEKFCPALIEYIQVCEKFTQENTAMVKEYPFYDGEATAKCLAEGKIRLQQSDIEGLLNIGTDYILPMFIHKDEDSYLRSLGLQGKKFITLHRGCNAQDSAEVVKLWPLAHYDRLAVLLKAEYPDCLLVELGVDRERCPKMDAIDLNLAGRTTMEEVKVLLRHALLHIDGEGGFVHLRRALKAKPSVVLFGPTCMEVFGYPGNINIRGDGCKEPCEWKTRDWLVNCPRGLSGPPCMTSIRPEQVMKQIRPFMAGHQEEKE